MNWHFDKARKVVKVRMGCIEVWKMYTNIYIYIELYRHIYVYICYYILTIKRYVYAGPPPRSTFVRP